MESALLFIDGRWRDGAAGRRAAVLDPSTEEQVADVAFAEADDLDEAASAAARSFLAWSAISSLDRARVLRQAATLMRDRVEVIAASITREQGKPLAEARLELGAAADTIDWFADEGRRAYGRIVPSRSADVIQMVVKEPVGPVAGFSPWNFPVSQLVRKVAPALAAGCTIVAKAPEETPSCAVETVRCFVDAGLPKGVLNLVFGIPSEISTRLIASRHIRKISFTGSVPVGRHLGILCAEAMKRTTMELGGHAPFIVTRHGDIDAAAKLAAMLKFRNAGQVCAAPTRFLIERSSIERFVETFARETNNVKVGPGNRAETKMGPLAHAGRLKAMEGFVDDAVARGADLRAGGRREGNIGYFFQPTILVDVSPDANVMNDEPFGPIAIVNPFDDLDHAIEEANRLPFGLCSFAFTSDLAEAAQLARRIEAGTVSINHAGNGLPEVPFGGVKESGHGSEGGLEGLQAYLVDKLVTQRSAA